MHVLFFQGMDKIISFVLCRIFGCVVVCWWTDKPVPAVIFSACHKCCFCMLRRAGTLWSFDSAQQGRGGQAAEVPKFTGCLCGKWAGVFLLTSWVVSSTCLHYMVKVPLTPILTTPAWELEINLQFLQTVEPLLEELLLNTNFKACKIEWKKMASCWR